MLLFHSYEALKKYCDFEYNPLDKVVLGEEITSLRELFLNSSRTNEQFAGIGEWDVSNVNNMACMFCRADDFNQPLNNWDVSNVTDMHDMFLGAVDFNQPLNNWDVANVEDMSYMFDSAKNFNQPLDKWDVSRVWVMECMFLCAESFNQPLDNFSSEQKIQAHYHFDEVKYKKDQANKNNSSSNSSEG